jgi:hypothetical protein
MVEHTLQTSTASTAKEPKDSRSLLGNGVGMALKRMPTSLHVAALQVRDAGFNTRLPVHTAVACDVT